MKRLLCINLLFFFLLFAKAQEKNQYMVKAGQIPEKAIPPEAIYTFTSFLNGEATLKNGALSRQRFNYNCLLDEIQFLNQAGDTMAIAEPELLQKVQIDSLVYYYSKGYLKQLIKTPRFTLAVSERILRADSKKQAAYGGSTSTSAIDNYTNIYSGGRSFKLELKQDILFRKTAFFFLGDVYNHFVRADKKGFYNVFGNRRNEIETFVKAERINFNDASDIEKLFLYCTRPSSR